MKQDRSRNPTVAIYFAGALGAIATSVAFSIWYSANVSREGVEDLGAVILPSGVALLSLGIGYLRSPSWINILIALGFLTSGAAITFFSYVLMTQW